MILRKVVESAGPDAPVIGYMLKCPGCKGYHYIATGKPNSIGHKWTFDGNMDRPTFSPSIHQLPGNGVPRCHFHVTAGMIAFCSDSEHALAGQTVPMVDDELPDD